jgi:hypothetical protein
VTNRHTLRSLYRTVTAIIVAAIIISCGDEVAQRNAQSPSTGETATPATPEPASQSAEPTRHCPGIPRFERSAWPWDPPDSAQWIFLVSPKRFGRTESGLRSCLGEPLKLLVDTVSNIHTDEPDVVLTFVYPGIRYKIYRVLANGKDILFEVLSDGPTSELAFGIRVGIPYSQVVEALGPPTHENPSDGGAVDAVYLVDEFLSESFRFWVENGVVTRITWSFYID